MSALRSVFVVAALGLLGSGCGSQCTAVTNLTATRVCTPDGGAQAGQALSLVAESCDGCSQTTSGCAVSVQGTTLTVSLSGQQCTTGGQACPALCKLTQTTCSVGPLDAGTYALQGAVTGSLTVVAAGGGTSCTNGLP